VTVPRRRRPATVNIHGGAPTSSVVALLLIDVINDLEFDAGATLLRRALPAARRIAALKERAARAGVPVIYVNDNFGKWRSDFRTLVAHCLDDGVRGEPLARLLAPGREEYFVLKPMHSGFYGTTLALLLRHLGVDTLVLTGFTADTCVLFTANDAYMRGFRLYVPVDCVASVDPRIERRALQHLKAVVKADLRRSNRLDLAGLARRTNRRRVRSAASAPRRKRRR
jgi:nicotinamidase-related amidase